MEDRRLNGGIKGKEGWERRQEEWGGQNRGGWDERKGDQCRVEKRSGGQRRKRG